MLGSEKNPGITVRDYDREVKRQGSTVPSPVSTFIETFQLMAGLVIALAIFASADYCPVFAVHPVKVLSLVFICFWYSKIRKFVVPQTLKRK